MFEQGAQGWVEAAVLIAPDGLTGDAFGGDLAFDGNTLVVGAAQAASHGLTASGAGYVFAWDGSSWDAGERLDDTPFAAFGIAGHDVAIQGNRLLLGGYDISPSGQGAAHLYKRFPTGWVHWIEIAGGLVDEHLGRAVAVRGEALLIGAPGSLSGGPAGRLYLYRDLGSLGPVLVCDEPIEADPQGDLGTAVALDGRRASAGAPGLAPGVGEDAGVL